MPWSSLAPRFPAICGSATLAMDVSSTSMNAASATVAAMIQGLTLGFHCASAAPGKIVPLALVCWVGCICCNVRCSFAGRVSGVESLGHEEIAGERYAEANLRTIDKS